jgi:tRNA threonylcarbamoyl adenosine modification protein YeaZ
MKILALEFSSPQRSVAVVRGAEAGVTEVVETGSGAMRALAMIDGLLREAKLEREQMDCLAVGLGPGSYTGIRAGIALAQGWQIARGIRLLGISSVECLAAQAQAEGLRNRVNIVIDAQRNELYLAVYEITAQARREAEPLRIVSLEEIQKRERAGGIWLGPEVRQWLPGGRVLFPSAARLARMAVDRSNFISGEKLEPIYLREANFVKAPPPRIMPL